MSIDNIHVIIKLRKDDTKRYNDIETIKDEYFDKLDLMGQILTKILYVDLPIDKSFTSTYFISSISQNIDPSGAITTNVTFIGY